MNARILLVAVLCAVTPGAALAQALTSLASVRVGYVTRKNTVKPQGELKAQIDALDAQIAEAARLGRNGELRRLYAKGSRCSRAGRGPMRRTSRTLSCCASPRVVVDSAQPYTGTPRTDLRAGDPAASVR